MAINDNGTQVMDQGQLWAGLHTTGTIPEVYLPRGMDNLGQMAYISKGYTKFLSMLHTLVSGKSKTVKTREPRTHQITELDRTFSVKDGHSVTADHALITLDASQANQIQPNDTLYMPELFSRYNKDTKKFEYSRTFSPEFTDIEQLLVLNVGAPDPITNKSVITLRRAMYGRGKEHFTGELNSLADVDFTNGAILEGDLLLRGLPSFPEGSDAPRGFFKNPEVDNNFTQEFKYALEITKESEIEKTLIGKTPIEIYRLLKTKQAALDIERTMIFGRKGKLMDKLGRVQYMMGGVLEYIPKDDRHVHIYKNPMLSYPDLLDFLSVIPEEGGSPKRTMYTGISLYTEFKKALYSSGYLRYNKEETARFDIPIETIVGAGVEVSIVPLWTLQECGWGYRGFVVDHTVPSFTPITHEGWDMKVEKDIQEKGQQIYKEQWIGIKGLERRYAEYQHIVDFSSVA